jgi:hypothetical protein
VHVPPPRREAGVLDVADDPDFRPCNARARRPTTFSSIATLPMSFAPKARLS